MISLCCPTRGRPDRFERMVESATRTAEGELEVVAVLDEGDRGAWAYPVLDGVRYVTASARPLSDLWNVAAAEASGELLHLCADDLEFVTPGWDRHVRDAFAAFSDGIVLVWGDDGTPHRRIATHPFISRRWYEVTGQMTAPYYEAWCADTWLLDLAVKVRRLAYLPGVRIHHQHVDFGDAPDDATYQLRRPLRPAPELARRPAWTEREDERVEQARRLAAAMTSPGRSETYFYLRSGHRAL